MDDSYLAMAPEAASLCSSIQDELAELAAMEAAGATEVVASTSGIKLSPAVPGKSAAATITPARKGTSSRATRATKTSTPVRPSSEFEDDGDYEDFSAVTDNHNATLDSTNVELMLKKSVKLSTREKYSPACGTSGWHSPSSRGCPQCHQK
jgi:hypothetical protein